VIVIPAIDVRGGRAVRLRLGDPEHETVYGEDPAEVAARWSAEGASWIHVVDLDAALGSGDNRRAIARILAAADVPCQVGGGVRALEDAARRLEAGAARVVMGTEAVRDPAFLSAAMARFGDAVVVALDTDGDEVLIRGWTEGAGLLDHVLPRMAEAGASRFLVTAVGRDGTMSGPDAALYERVVASTDRPVQASGGVRSVEDLQALAVTGVDAVVVGTALYEGTLSLAEALEVAG
jgi:phosphoribosylformimino-5-aminoimidazole carboxamide ribotide isomerase